MSTFDAFMKIREAAAAAFCNGDGAEVAALSTGEDPASFFGPDGGALRGASRIRDAYVDGASSFGPGGRSELEVIHAAEGGEIAHWAGLQKATVMVDGKDVPMTLRITELFRREDGKWMLVHRHADMLKA